MSEKTLAKAKTYLEDGKVRVVSADAVAGRAVFRVQGSSPKPYMVIADRGGWVCDCPAHVLECVHIIACRTIFELTAERTVRLNTKPDADLDKFFAQFNHSTD